MATHALSPSSRGLRLPLALGGSDDALRRRAAGGEAAAFAKLYERHHQPLYRYCRSIVGHEQDAQDALHNTMLRAWEALQGDERDVPVRPWLFRIAHNESISLLRRRRPTEELDAAQWAEAPGVENQAETRSQLTSLVADLGELPDRQRSALILRELCGFSHEEIAAVHGGSAATAKQTIFAAREGLHDFAEGRVMSCEAVKRLLSDDDRRKHRGRKLRAHLRACTDCSGFQTELRDRPEALAALSPALPAASAASLLAGILSQGSHGAVAGGSVAGASAVGGAVVAKVAVGAAILATAGVGAVSGLDPLATRDHRASSARSEGTGATGAAAAVQQEFTRAELRAASLRARGVSVRPESSRRNKSGRGETSSAGSPGRASSNVGARGRLGKLEKHAGDRGLSKGKTRTPGAGRRAVKVPSRGRAPARTPSLHQPAKPAPRPAKPVKRRPAIEPAKPEVPAGVAPGNGKLP